MGESGVVSAGVAGLKWAWKHQDEIEPKLKAIYRSVRRRIFGRPPGVLILGAGGAGKTTLGRILSGKFDFLFDLPAAYEQSVSVQTFRGKDNPDVELIVAPGQEDRREATWPSLLRRLAEGKEFGVILCCSYGYHSLTTSYKYHKLYDEADARNFLPKYLAGRRDEEVRIVKEIAGALEQSPRPTWLLTLVAKADLWWPEEQKVREFYTAGKYGRVVQELTRKKKGKLFRHELALGLW